MEFAKELDSYVSYGSDSDSENSYNNSDCDNEYEVFSSASQKLQSRFTVSKAMWVEELGMSQVLEKKGKLWNTTGRASGGKIYCSIEETLYLSEIGALEVLNAEGTPLTLTNLYEKLAGDKNKYGCSWESFEVYRHLKFLGYIVSRYGIPWSPKNTTNQDITQMFSNLRISETRPIFDVYPPNSTFKKTSPGTPLFALFLISGDPLSNQEIKDLEARFNGSDLKFCSVEHGRVSIWSFTKVELPVLP